MAAELRGTGVPAVLRYQTSRVAAALQRLQRSSEDLGRDLGPILGQPMAQLVLALAPVRAPATWGGVR
jgi:hypothetical protein